MAALHDFHAGHVDVRKLALTIEQVQAYGPPPNPAKMKDTRAAGYVEKYGANCWEVDALPPDVLHEIIGDAFKMILDTQKMGRIVEQEDRDKERFREIVSKTFSP